MQANGDLGMRRSSIDGGQDRTVSCPGQVSFLVMQFEFTLLDRIPVTGRRILKQVLS